MKAAMINKFALLMSGKVDMEEYFYGDFTFNNVRKAHEILDAQTAYGKIVLKT